MSTRRVVAWAAAFLFIILFGQHILHKKEEAPAQRRLSLEQIEEIWPKATPAFRDAVFRDSLASAGIVVSRDGSFIAREPLLDSNCRGKAIAKRSLDARGNISDKTVRALVQASACYTLTGRWG